LAHRFRGNSPWLADSFVSLPWWGRILWKKGMTEKSCSAQWPWSREWQTGSGKAQDIYFQGTPQWTAFFNWAPPPFFHHYPIMPLNYNSIKGLIHSLGQIPKDKNHFSKAHQLAKSPQYMSLWRAFHIQMMPLLQVEFLHT
jgi:hypothetical protein